ncbi:MAG TPA: dynamin family protein [Trebonia sp.]|jgi:GTP-binding protein EngB required for normal cell division|nr:dynamin family protein [Trebonia sp.]
MVTVDRRTALRRALGELAALAPESDAGQLDALAGRLATDRLRVLVAGEAKRGKSTVVNALIGRAVLPSGVTPLTAVATTLRYGTDEHVTVTFTAGAMQQRPLSDLPELVTEPGNPGNRLGIADVTVYLDVPLLAEGVELVDTPGTGSVYEHNTAEAERALQTLDAAVLVLTADPPPSAAERDLLRRIAEHSVVTFVLLNKADRLDPAEREEVLAFAAGVVRESAGAGVPVYPASARASLAGQPDAGFADFTAGFREHLRAGRAADVEQSVAGHLRRITLRLLDEVRLARRASQLRAGQAADRVAAFRDRLVAVSARRGDASGLAWAQQQLRARLDESHARDSQRLVSLIASDLGRYLTGPLAGAAAAEIEQRGYAWLTARAREEADGWREDQRRALEVSLAELDDRLKQALRGELGQIRDDARELLELDLAMPEAAERLAPARTFFYSGMEASGQTDLLAGAIRRHLPGEAGRRRARSHLVERARDMVPMLIGRARGDLQSRLEESMRRLVKASDQRYADSIGRLAAVLDQAVADQDRTGPPEADQQHALDDREDALNGVLSLLGGAVSPVGKKVGADAELT